MRFRLCFNDVGVGTRIAVIGPDPVVIERVRGKTGDARTSHIANIQIVVGWHESTKRAVDRNVQEIAARAGNTGPVRH